MQHVTHSSVPVLSQAGSESTTPGETKASQGLVQGAEEMHLLQTQPNRTYCVRHPPEYTLMLREEEALASSCFRAALCMIPGASERGCRGAATRLAGAARCNAIQVFTQGRRKKKKNAKKKKKKQTIFPPISSSASFNSAIQPWL